MQTKYLTATALIISIVWLSGCTSSKVDLQAITFSEWQTKLKSYHSDIVVVDLWATWCVSCIERFPKMVELHYRYQDKGVRFVSMCLDDHTDLPAIKRAQEFLVKVNADFENYLMDENLMDAFTKLELIGIPAVFIYDRTGKQKYRLTGDNPNKQFSDQDIEVAIQELLKNSV